MAIRAGELRPCISDASFYLYGWVALAPNHTGNLLGDHQSPLPTAHHIHRPLDIQEALDQASELELSGMVNTGSVMMSGHSFGASYTTWAVSGATYDNLSNVCENGDGIEDDAAGCTDQERQIFGSGALADPRVAVAFPMAGTVREAFFGAEGYKGVSSPVMFASGTEDGEERNQAILMALKNRFSLAESARWLSSELCHGGLLDSRYSARF